MKRIAVITGASSGMGAQFVKTIREFGTELDEIWVIARRKERLEQLQAAYPLRPIALDLADRASYAVYQQLLEAEQPRVELLINASGFGKFCATMDVTTEENLNMVDLNCQALMAMCQISIPYMGQGSKIINIASVAAYQPIPYINVYGATKAFVMRFSRGLNREVQKRGIGVMTMCPFWTKTAFFDRAIAKDADTVVKKYVAMYTAEDQVKRAWRDLKRGKDISKFGFVARFQMILAKLLPHSFVMDYWMNQQRLN